VRGDDHYVERLKDELRWATLERDIYRDVVADQARHGVRFDMNPTIDHRVDPHAWWSEYVRRIDSSIRLRALHALEEAKAML
jgi:hypothetical protein